MAKAKMGGEAANLKTVEGQVLTVKINGDRLALIDQEGGAFVEQADVNQSNGVVHVIDSVLMPKQGQLPERTTAQSQVARPNAAKSGNIRARPFIGVVMRFLTTFLAATAVCTALLVGSAYWIDAPHHEPQSTGLTAATVLGTDGVEPVGRPSDPGTVASGGVAASDQG